MTVSQARTAPGAGRPHGVGRPQEIALVDLLDRLLATGVVVAGEVTLSIAGVDLVQVSLRALVSSVRAPVGLPDVGASGAGTRHG